MNRQTIFAWILVAMSVYLVGCISSPTPEQKRALVGTWQKVDNEDLIVEFTAGENIIISNGTDVDSTYYLYDGRVLHFNSVWWTVEFRSEREMLLVTESTRGKSFEGEWHLMSRPSVSGGVATLPELKSKLLAYQKSDRHLASLLPELQKSKKQLIDRLRELDVRLASDLKNKPEARTLAEELAELVQQIRVATTKRTEYKKASDTIESLSRRLTRRDELKNAGLTDEELEEASQLMAELDDRFNEASSDVEKALNLEEVLKKEL